jgi:hypothetical protein
VEALGSMPVLPPPAAKKKKKKEIKEGAYFWGGRDVNTVLDILYLGLL